MVLSPRKNGLTSLFKEVRGFQGSILIRPGPLGSMAPQASSASKMEGKPTNLEDRNLLQ